MNKLQASIVLAGLLGLSALNGCVSLQSDVDKVGAGALSNQAVAALAQAESDVSAARAAFTLWTTAEEALLKARQAAQVGDSARVIGQASLVSELCKLSAAQAGYPTTEMKK
jgi:flagellar basal body L-ring protein FlgH